MSEKPPLKVVLLYSGGHFGSTILLNHLAKKNKHWQVVGIVRSFLIPAKSITQLNKRMGKAGWKFVFFMIWQVVVQGFAFLCSLLSTGLYKRMKPGWVVSIVKNIPTHNCFSINDVRTVQFIRNLEPDLIVSAYFSQILKKPVLDSAKIGCINVHPGYLPMQRGAMNYFWVLANDKPYAGVSVHWMDEGIDTGKVLSRKAFPIKPDDTQHKIKIYTAIIGLTLLKRALKKIYNEGKVEGEALDHTGSEYFATPDKAAFDRYFAKRRYFRFRDVFKFVFKKI